MASGRLGEALHHLRNVTLRQDLAGMSDGQLLDSFLTTHDEFAFAVLMQRHGPMVWGVCRRILGRQHDAEDAFQATFLILVRKAAAIMPRQMVGNYLYGIAYQTARKAKALLVRRFRRESVMPELPERDACEGDQGDQPRSLLDQELSRLPDIYRNAIVLCDLEGLTRKDAARQIGCPEGTLAGRLRRGRLLLAKRLARHGLGPAAVLTGAVVLPAVAAATVRAAAKVAAGQAVSDCASPSVAVLTEGVLSAMVATKMKAATAVLLLVGVLGAGTFWLGQGPGDMVVAQEVPKVKPASEGDKPDPNDFLKAARDRAVIEEQRQTAIVEQTIREAPDAVAKNPVAALQRLRDTMVQVLDNPDIGERVRDDLLGRLVASRRQLNREEKEEDKAVWSLDFKFKNLRLITVDAPGQGKRSFWYLWYEVVNNTGQARTFVPDFELLAADKVYHDEVLPKVQEAVRRLEDPAQLFDLKNSVTIAAEPIPPAKGAEKKGVVGVALLQAVNAKTYTLFVSGLSNGWTRSGAEVRRKVLKISFKRVDDELLLAGPPEWVYRSVKPDGENREEDPQDEVQRLIKQVNDRILILEQEMPQWDRKREQLLMQIRLTEGEIEKAAGNAELRAELTKKKEALEREAATCEAESTVRHLAWESHRKRLKELERLLKTSDKSQQD